MNGPVFENGVEWAVCDGVSESLARLLIVRGEVLRSV